MTDVSRSFFGPKWRTESKETGVRGPCSAHACARTHTCRKERMVAEAGVRHS